MDQIDLDDTIVAQKFIKVEIEISRNKQDWAHVDPNQSKYIKSK